MSAYADTNFLTRLYLGLAEKSPTPLPPRITRMSQPFPVTWLHRVEACNAMQLYVFRARSGVKPRITSEFAGAAWAQFRDDLSAGNLRTTDLPLADLMRRAEDLSLKHTAREGFRSYDLFHVASALILNCAAFLSFDGKASRLAQLEGLEIISGVAS